MTGFDWDDIFEKAHLKSWPTQTMSIQKAIYERDSKEISKQASVHRWELIFPLNSTQCRAIVHFRKIKAIQPREENDLPTVEDSQPLAVA